MNPPSLMLENDDASWSDVWREMTGLWPTNNFTDQEQASFRRVLGRYIKEQAVPALRGWKDTHDRAPKPSQLAEQMRTQYSNTATPGTDILRKRQERNRWHDDMNAYIDAMSEEEFSEALHQVYEWSPAIKRLTTGDPRKSYVIRSCIYQTQVPRILHV